MRKLIGVIVALALAWAGFWAYARGQLDKAQQTWLAGKLDAGWQIDASDRSIAGFPNRLDSTLRDLVVAPPDRTWEWRAPFLQVFALVYQPNHLIVVWPDQQTIAMDGETFTLGSQDLRASVVRKSDRDLDRLTIQGKGLRMQAKGEPGIWYARALTASARQLPGGDAQMALDIQGLTGREDASIPGPEDGATLQLDMTYHLTAPLVADLGLGLDQAAPKGVTLHRAVLSWQGLRATAKGKIMRDSAGYASGQIDLDITGWSDGMTALDSLKGEQAKNAKTLIGLLAVVAAFSGDANKLRVPLRFEDGQMFLGNLPVGEAPKI